MTTKRDKPSKVQSASELLDERSSKYKAKRAGAGDLVQITARISSKDWIKMTELRVREGLSHQEQIVFGLGLLFERFGMEPPELPKSGSK